jgi:hypothetical protein
MKNRINQPSTDQHAHNDRPLYFTDQSSADEVARLIVALPNTSIVFGIKNPSLHNVQTCVFVSQRFICRSIGEVNHVQ